ncbi:hypothetical protein [Vibrio maerlii]|uniref:hypothetical protein n=1 Tax=Vibrio maerlii TaxID=2231648 RepID=UPI000E3E88F0|nr:hypothetical protein [Vibrio maerlii]
MKRLLLLATPLLSFQSIANDTLIESIERFTDIFSVSLSQSPDNDKTVATLDINYQLTDQFRIFGEVDTRDYWQAGLGYSFWQGDTYYTENNLKVSEHEINTGIFAAKLIHEQWTLLAELNYNFMDKDSEFDNAASKVQFNIADTFDYGIGTLWSPVKYVDILYKFNHEIGVTKDSRNLYVKNDYPILGIDSGHYKNKDRFNHHYHEVAMFLNLKYLKPSVTYTFDLEYSDNNFVEFGLAFDF